MAGNFVRELEIWRVDRIAMAALIAGATAHGFGAGPRQVIQAAAIAALAAVGVFYLLLAAEWRNDRVAGKGKNPIATGRISPWTTIALATAGFAGSLVWAPIVNDEIILPLAGVIFIVTGLAVKIFDPPILRTVSRAALNGLYALVGGLAAGPLEPAMVLVAFFLFFVMIGGRVTAELRDFHYDAITGTLTIPRKYGQRWAIAFLLLSELTAYLMALAVCLTGALRVGYLFCVLAIILFWTIFNLILVRRPVPEMASLVWRLSHGVLGTLYLLAMILGRR